MQLLSKILALAVIFVVCCSFGYSLSLSGKRVIAYKTLQDSTAYVDESKGCLQLSFWFADSYVDIVDYKLRSDSTNGSNEYYLTFIGQYPPIVKLLSKPLVINSDMKITRDKNLTVISIPMKTFNAGKDKLYYEDRKNKYLLELKVNK